MEFHEFFRKATDHPQPFPFQSRLAQNDWPDLLDIPTGLGKTAAVTLAWLFKRGWRAEGQRMPADDQTPRRLIWCLPMRVLVEQTERNIRDWLTRLEVVGEPGDGKVSVHVLMGGESDLKSWADHPEEDMILIGTQDMLLSRALMRGYGMSRYQWPVHFALLHNDCLWAYDEVQLMGAGLATSAQLEAFRRAFPLGKNSRSLWLSATLNREWLATIDLQAHLPDFHALTISDDDRQLAGARISAHKSLERGEFQFGPQINKAELAEYIDAFAQAVLAAHDPTAQTLVVVNRVDRAQALFAHIRQARPDTHDLLIHARFRPAERRMIEQRLRNEESTNRIVVATQAIEAGVDITSKVLFTELAPWSSLVQRFGRCNRYGELNATGGGRCCWIDIDPDTEAKDLLPYDKAALDDARARLGSLQSASPEDLPKSDQPRPLAPVLRRKDLLDLFNTDPDLSGFDVDVSDYIRDTGTPSFQVFWRDAKNPDGDEGDNTTIEPAPLDLELCPVSMGQAEKLSKSRSAWVWDGLTGRWQELNRRPSPGMTILLRSQEGGYDCELGFVADGKQPVSIDQERIQQGQLERAIEDDRRSTETQFAVPLLEHLANVGQHAEQLVSNLVEDDGLGQAISRAGYWHDVGKSHPAFQNMLLLDDEVASEKQDRLWAKSEKRPGKPTSRAIYAVCGGSSGYTTRPGFRHELASALAWLEQHDQAGAQPTNASLIAYLIAAHHGKIRMSMRALPTESGPKDERSFARGIWQGDGLPEIRWADETSEAVSLKLDWMALGESGTNASWTARTQALLSHFGPFALAWAEALVRIADWRASAAEQRARLEASQEKTQDDGHELATKHSPLASPERHPTTRHSDAKPAAQGGAQHGVRRRAGEPAHAGTGTRKPAEATRRVTTHLGDLSYPDLAPLLAQRVEKTARAINEGVFANYPLDSELLLELHQRVCGDLTPQFAGRWRTVNVVVGSHEPPEFHQVPTLMLDYVRDLDTRISYLPEQPDDLWLEFLAFAEGRLLSIHPFQDFNGRVSRLLMDLLVQRLMLPEIDPIPSYGQPTQDYLSALRAADRMDLTPLKQIWQVRLSNPSATDLGDELPLQGCTPTPLAGYLKALGVLRILGEQQLSTPSAGYWRDDHFCLETDINSTDLVRFFLECYQPSPVLSPWNGGSGFYPKDKAAAVSLQKLETARSERFQIYAALIRQTRKLLGDLALTEAPKDEEKTTLLQALRAQWPEAALPWVDAAILVLGERRDASPLLGKGGIEGRLDFSANYAQQVTQLWDLETGEAHPNSAALLRNALFAEPVAGLASASPGQLDPFAAGGPNAGIGYEVDARATGLVNPWDYLFMLEGAMLLGSRATRRLQSQARAAASFPFTVRSSGTGAGSTALADDQNNHAEMWLPLWSNPATLPELQQLLGEGRVTVGRHAARDGFEFRRAIASLGTDRGILAFQRYGFYERRAPGNGYYVATPLQRVEVKSGIYASLVDDLDKHGWLSKVRSVAREKGVSNAFQGQVRQLENVLLKLLDRVSTSSATTDPLVIQAVLISLGKLLREISRSRKLMEKIRPRTDLAKSWVLAADDRSPEYRLAVAIAGLGRADDLPFVAHVLPLDEKMTAWDQGSRRVTWSGTDLCSDLIGTMFRRLTDQKRSGQKKKPTAGIAAATQQAIHALLTGTLSEQRVQQLVLGLSSCSMPASLPRIKNTSADPLPWLYCYLKPMMLPEEILHECFRLPDGGRLPIPTEFWSLLRTGRVGGLSGAAEVARRRYKASSLPISPVSEFAVEIPAAKLAAALAIPVNASTTQRIAHQILKPLTKVS